MAWRASGYEAGPPTVTGGIVWTVNKGSSTLLGYSVSTGHQAYSFPLGSTIRFTGPAAGDGHVFVAAKNQVVSFLLG
jgi:hypothetical protein